MIIFKPGFCRENKSRFSIYLLVTEQIQKSQDTRRMTSIRDIELQVLAYTEYLSVRVTMRGVTTSRTKYAEDS